MPTLQISACRSNVEMRILKLNEPKRLHPFLDHLEFPGTISLSHPNHPHPHRLRPLRQPRIERRQRVAAQRGERQVERVGGNHRRHVPFGKRSGIERGRRSAFPTQPFASSNRRFETAATCLDCCLSQEILDGGNELLIG